MKPSNIKQIKTLKKVVRKKNCGFAKPFFPPVTAKATPEPVVSSTGFSLPSETKGFFEPRFGFSFDHVKIHSDNSAAQSAENLNAEAYTYGNHIVFNNSQYNPHSTEGKKLLAHELSHVMQQHHRSSFIQRKMKIPFHDKPAFNSADQQTSQGEIILKYMNQLCGDAKVAVSGSDVVLPKEFCTKPAPDAKEPNPLSRADLSKTPVSCNCFCDLDASAKIVTMQVDDNIEGLTEFTADPGEEKLDAPRGATVTVPSEYGKKVTQTMKSGKKEVFKPYIVLGHELCGHAWLAIKGELQKDENAERGRGGHQETVERENMIRREHGETERNKFREPYCGEVDDSSYQQECKVWRDEYNKLNGTSYTLADTVPEKEAEEKPADFTFDVFFNKDMPQSWFNPAASYNVSVTDEGKKQFDEAVKFLNDFHPGKKFQLEGHASIEKPVNDPDYNIRLSKRRTDLVLSELSKNGVDTSRLADKADSGCDSFADGMKNCSDTESSKDINAKDRRTVIRIF